VVRLALSRERFETGDIATPRGKHLDIGLKRAKRSDLS
jgi:hypothetical protein